jgi:hypothetical protein
MNFNQINYTIKLEMKIIGINPKNGPIIYKYRRTSKMHANIDI